MALSLILDFDGTLVERTEPLRWRRGARETLVGLARAGYRLVLHSCRATPVDATQNPDLDRERFYGTGEVPAEVMDQWKRFGEMREFLRREGVLDLLEIWQAPGKPYGLIMIDDRAEEPDWASIYAALIGKPVSKMHPW